MIKCKCKHKCTPDASLLLVAVAASSLLLLIVSSQYVNGASTAAPSEKLASAGLQTAATLPSPIKLVPKLKTAPSASQTHKNNNQSPPTQLPLGTQSFRQANMQIVSQFEHAAAIQAAAATETLDQQRAVAASPSALIQALIASFSVILVSELGDKTFIITAIMAMKNSRAVVFFSSSSALLLMTVLSVCMGVAVTMIPKLYTHYALIVLFLGFGFKMLKEAYDMSVGCADSASGETEFDEVKRELEHEDNKNNNNCSNSNSATMKVVFNEGKVATTEQSPTGVALNAEPQLVDEQQTKQQLDNDSPPTETANKLWSRLRDSLSVAPIAIKVFTMIFVAEWGDRSQISTIILAARENFLGVFAGSLAGHVFCTGLAVIGGRFVAEMISVRTMTLLGGLVFLSFATLAIVSGPE